MKTIEEAFDKGISKKDIQKAKKFDLTMNDFKKKLDEIGAVYAGFYAIETESKETKTQGSFISAKIINTGTTNKENRMLTKGIIDLIENPKIAFNIAQYKLEKAKEEVRK